MSSKARLCAACGRWSETGVWVREEDGDWWVHDEQSCVEGAVVLDPQPSAPEVYP